MATYTMTEANRRPSRLINEARYGHEPVLITDHGETAAALISPAALARFQMLEEAADQAMIDEIKAGGPKWVPAAEGFAMMEDILAEAEATQER